MGTLIHRYITVDGLYHAIQTDPAVGDEQVVAVPSLGEVAVVCGTQPMAVDPASRAFPALADPNAWRQVAHGRYYDAARLARCVAAGLATNPSQEPIATGAGTFRAIYDRAYGFGMARFESQAVAALACHMFGADLIAALNNFTKAKNEWFYSDHGHSVHAFYKARWCCDACRADAADRLARPRPSVSRS